MRAKTTTRSRADIMEHHEEVARRTAGQRRINLIWESTQAIVAVSVTVTSLAVFSVLAMRDQWTTATLGMLSNAFFLVIGFYFGRTKHARSGGVGARPSQER